MQHTVLFLTDVSEQPICPIFKVSNSENGTGGFPETSVMDYHCTLGTIPEERRSQDSRLFGTLRWRVMKLSRIYEYLDL